MVKTLKSRLHENANNLQTRDQIETEMLDKSIGKFLQLLLIIMEDADNSKRFKDISHFKHIICKIPFDEARNKQDVRNRK